MQQDGTLTAGQLTEMAKASVSETQVQIAALCLKEDDNSITTSGDPNERQQLLALKQAYYEVRRQRRSPHSAFLISLRRAIDHDTGRIVL